MTGASMAGGRLNVSSGKKSSIAAEASVRRAEASMRNDKLLENALFREFLTAVANRAQYFGASFNMPEGWFSGYNAALRDIVNGVVLNSSKGSEWLREYAASAAMKYAKKERTSDE